MASIVNTLSDTQANSTAVYIEQLYPGSKINHSVGKRSPADGPHSAASQQLGGNEEPASGCGSAPSS